jgi:diguanylate cyclase (GGDEF)-like protein
LKEFIPSYVQPEKIRELERTAMLDYLTGIGNRMFLEARLKETIFEREVFGVESCVIFMDLDNFKETNDKFGHDAGDKLLKEFAKFLISSFMSYDYIGRWGGDEFMVILNAITLEDVPKVIDRFYKHLSRQKVNINGDEIFIQVSAGVTGVNIGDSIETILSRCDKAIYKAKRTGKNQYFIISFL